MQVEYQKEKKEKKEQIVEVVIDKKLIQITNRQQTTDSGTSGNTKLDKYQVIYTTSFHIQTAKRNKDKEMFEEPRSRRRKKLILWKNKNKIKSYFLSETM